MTRVCIDLLLRTFTELNPVRAVNLLRDDLDLLRDRQVEVVQELEVGLALTDGDDGFSERTRAGTALSPVVANNCGVRTAGERLLTDELEFGRCVGAI